MKDLNKHTDILMAILVVLIAVAFFSCMAIKFERSTRDNFDQYLSTETLIAGQSARFAPTTHPTLAYTINHYRNNTCYVN